MKKALTLAAVMVFMGSMWTAAAHAGRIHHRQVRQQKRICQGVRSGQLTRHETVSLERQQRHIRQSKRRAWSDGQLTPRERVRLEYQQDRASRRFRQLLELRKKHLKARKRLRQPSGGSTQ